MKSNPLPKIQFWSILLFLLVSFGTIFLLDAGLPTYRDKTALVLQLLPGQFLKHRWNLMRAKTHLELYLVISMETIKQILL